MLIQPRKGIVPLGVLVLALIVVATIYSGAIARPSSESITQWWESRKNSTKGQSGEGEQSLLVEDGLLAGEEKQIRIPTFEIADTHQELFSPSTPTGSYFEIIFGDYHTINPNILPHPTKNHTYVIVGQEFWKGEFQSTTWNMELVCDATFREGSLQCVKQPLLLPIAATSSTLCDEALTPFNFNIGPHDARVFFGPEIPFIIYGSQSKNSCFGQWLHDFRLLMNWGHWRTPMDPFQVATDLQRPPPYGKLEKNWFVFWDSQNEIYAHYDVAPHRVFSKLGPDGSASIDLAPAAAYHDDICLLKYLPTIENSEEESIHQATNSLSITLCQRDDPSCTPSDANTYIMAIFQHKYIHGFHSTYEPYVMLFKRSAPFEIHGISTKPLWIHGRKTADTHHGSGPSIGSEMFFITSMAWKTRGQTYHGYLDDELFLNFGIEDLSTGGIDILAADLVRKLGLCQPGTSAVA